VNTRIATITLITAANNAKRNDGWADGGQDETTTSESGLDVIRTN